jgi:3-hydroxyacyl-CoA dehydrogenase
MSKADSIFYTVRVKGNDTTYKTLAQAQEVAQQKAAADKRAYVVMAAKYIYEAETPPVKRTTLFYDYEANALPVTPATPQTFELQPKFFGCDDPECKVCN